MQQVRERLRRSLGAIGVWSFALDGLAASDEAAAARAFEAAGSPVLWIPEGSSSKEAFSHAAHLLATTDRLSIATGIANMWARDPVAMANGARTLGEAWPGRFVLGVGAGHEYSAQMRGFTWDKPFSRMQWYVEAMADAPYEGPEPDPAVPVLLAALGPRMLALAGTATAGAHTYFVPVEHTAVARRALGPDPVLAVEQTVVPVAEASTARELARSFAAGYLELPNYVKNLRRIGYTEDDVAGVGSDRLIDATIAWGTLEQIAERVRAHLDAGADHVCLQVILDSEGRQVGVQQVEELLGMLAPR